MSTEETGPRSHHEETTRSRMEALIAAMRRPAPAPASEPTTNDDGRLAAVAWQAMQRGAGADDETVDVLPAAGASTLDHGPPAGVLRRERASIELGRRLGRYMLIEELGRGGMGRVLRAYDPKLQREVALKLLNPEVVDWLGRARMVREARSMAQLRHPNVVAVYDVEDDPRHGVVLVMELVEGRTLREWLRERPRAWPEVLGVFLEAGRGLAAAHRQGLLHRDFKPANVLVGHDGRVEVSDFGLAKRSRDEGEPITGRISPAGAVTHGDDVGETLTEDGAVMGTPLYMAPEQHRGEPLTSAADQYAFCVALWEALHGERPFDGHTPAEQVDRALAGQLRAPPKGSTVPRWLRRACERGLAIDPARRWPSMDALLGALAKGRARARVRRGLAAAGMLALLGGGVEAHRRYEAAQRVAACEASGDEILTAWSPARRHALRDALLGTGVSHAATTAEKVMPWLDRQAADWSEARVEACLEVDVRGRWDDQTLERSRWCLDQRRTQLESVADQLIAADARVVSRAVALATGLLAVEPCRDERVLEALGLPPPAQREAIRAVREEVTRAASFEAAGRYDEGLARATAALAEAEGLAWRPLVAVARLRRGSLIGRTGDLAAAETTLEDAYFEALGVAPEVTFDTAIKLAFVVGVSAARPGDGRRWGRLAEAALAELGEHERARRGVLLARLADLHMVTGDYDEARTLYERALALDEELHGSGHPGSAETLNNLAVAHKGMGAYGEAKAFYERALAVRQEALGPRHPDVAQSLHNLGDLQWTTGDFAGAKQRYEQALAIREEALGSEHPEVAETLDNLAAVHAATGDHASARAASERGLAILEARLGPDHPKVATSLGILASIHLGAGAHAEAQAACERALGIVEARLGPEHPNVAAMLMCLAEVALAQQRPHDAIPLAQRALELRERAGVGVDFVEEARFVLARALWEAPADRGGDRSKAVTLAERARDGYRADGQAWPVELAEVEAWLATHPRPAAPAVAG